MSLDERLRRELRASGEPDVDAADLLEQFYARALPRGRRRRLATASALSITMLAFGAAAGFALRSSEPSRDLVRPVAEGIATPEPAEGVVRRSGVDVWYRVAGGVIGENAWEVHAYVNRSGQLCLHHEGDITHRGIRCWSGSFDESIGLDPEVRTASPTDREGVTPIYYAFEGFAPPDAARVRVLSGSGEQIEVETASIPGASARIYATVVSSIAMTSPFSYELLDRTGRSISGRHCAPDQYDLRLQLNGQGASGRMIAEPALDVMGLRGELPCQLLLVASLTIEHEEMGVYIAGNGAQADAQGLVRNRTYGLRWRWSNWCGQRTGLRYVVRRGGQVIASEPVTAAPDCVDPDKPSVLRGFSTEQPPQR